MPVMTARRVGVFVMILHLGVIPANARSRASEGIVGPECLRRYLCVAGVGTAYSGNFVGGALCTMV